MSNDVDNFEIGSPHRIRRGKSTEASAAGRSDRRARRLNMRGSSAARAACGTPVAWAGPSWGSSTSEWTTSRKRSLTPTDSEVRSPSPWSKRTTEFARLIDPDGNRFGIWKPKE